MKKILFVAHSLQSGGIERALINLLKLIDYSELDVSLLLLRNEGEYLNDLPSEIHLLGDYKNLSWTNVFCITWRSYLKKSILYGNFKGLYTVLIYLIHRLVFQTNESGLYKPFLKDIGEINDQYDLAIDFYGGGSITTFITDQKVRANKKITWIHSEAAIKKVKNIRIVLKKYERIFCVSQKCVNLFKDNVPEYADKCETFYNYVPVDEIKKKAQDSMAFFFDNTYINLLTVGRVSPEKGQFLALRAAKKLNKLCPDIRWRWYMIGSGSSLLYLKLLSKIMNLADQCIFLGYINNPYPFIRTCDIYIQPSQYEGFCTTITEAAILCKPIIATSVSGVEEQISNGEDGLIINYDKSELCEAILKLIREPELCLKFITDKEKKQYDFEKEIMKIKNILSEC